MVNNKPLMEKRRRARINNCLEQLRDVVVETICKKDPRDHAAARYSKLEKADLLELTVNYLKQYNAAVNAAMSEPEVLANYHSGYTEGIQVIDKFMSGQMRQGNVNAEFQGRVKSHLQSCAPQDPILQEKMAIEAVETPNRKRKTPSPTRDNLDIKRPRGMMSYGKPVALIPPKHKGTNARDASFASPVGVASLPLRLAASQTSTPRIPAGGLNFASDFKDPLRIDTSPAMLHQPVWPSSMLQQPWLSPVRNTLETAKPTMLAPVLPLTKAAVAPTQNAITTNTNNFIFIKVEQNKCNKKSSSPSNDNRDVCQNNNNDCNASCQYCSNCEVAAHSSSDEGIDEGSFKASSSSLRSSSSKHSSLDLSKDASSSSSNLSSANSSSNSLNSKNSSDSSLKTSKCAVWRPW